MWTYNQETGQVRDQNGVHLCFGYSGFGDGENNPSMQQVPDVGPIPTGLWKMGEPYNSNQVGPFAIPLTPVNGTITFGRSDFRIHGDSIHAPGTASKGCIVIPRWAREKMHESEDQFIKVI